MSASHVCLARLGAVLFVPWLISVSAMGQDVDAIALRASQPRALPPGVLTAIPSESEREETFSGPRELPDVVQGIPRLDWMPNYSPSTRRLLDMAEAMILRRGIWNLDFAFKPLRMLHVDVPQSNGALRKQLVWYLVYRVTNNGHHVQPKPQQDQFGNETYDAGYANHTIRFFPNFVLVDQEAKRTYLDQIIPSAVRAIARRESLDHPLLNSVSISRRDIPVSSDAVDRSIWGVATWTDIDPRVDFFSIFASGLTNAYRYEELMESYDASQPPGKGRQFERKTLQLNFWRPGDAVEQHEREIRYGVPGISDPIPEDVIFRLYGVQKRLDYQWIYR